MPAVQYPAAMWAPGAASGYRLTYDHPDGHTSMDVVKAHYTVGTDSRSRGTDGYFQFLVSRDGTVTQFAEVDAYCMDSGEWNGYGPGVEVEYLPGADDVMFTPAARLACGLLVQWLSAEWAVPLVYRNSIHDMVPTAGYRGFIAHRALIQSEEHQDYWADEDWVAMTGTPTGDDMTPEESKQLALVYNSVGGLNTILAAVNDLPNKIHTGTGRTNAEIHAQILAAPFATGTNRKRIADLVVPI